MFIYTKKLLKLWPFAVTFVFIYFVYSYNRKKQSDYFTSLQEMRDSHTREVNSIKLAYDIERKKHEENLIVLNQELDKAKKEYEELNHALEEKKKAKVKQIIDTVGKDPVGLADQFSAVTGFAIVK